MGVVIRQTLKASIANYIGVAIGFFNVIILMPLIFTEGEMGLVKMLTENMVMLAGLSTLGIASSMYRYYPYFKEDKTGKLHGFDFWTAVVPFAGFVFVTLILVFTKGWIVSIFSKNAAEFLEYYLLLIPLVFAQTFFAVFEVTSAIENRIVVPKLLKEVVMRLLTAVAFFTYYFGWLTFEQSVYLLIIFYFVPLILVFAYSVKLRKINWKPDFHFLKQNKKMIKDFVSYTSLVTIGSISGLILTRLDIIMLSSLKGLDFTGIYVIAIYVAAVIEIPRRALVQMLSTKISQQMKEEDFGEAEILYKKTSTTLFIGGLVLFMIVSVNINNLYGIMPHGQNFAIGAASILILGASKCVELLTSMGQIIIMYSKFYYIMFLMTIATTVLGIYLNLWMIPIYGITGAAIATAITIIVQQIIIGITIYGKLRFHSFTLTQLWAAILFCGIWVLNNFLPEIPNHWLDLTVRTLSFPLIYVFLVYKLKLSAEVNNMIDLILQRIKDRNFKPY